jgi:hypothetical protein
MPSAPVLQEHRGVNKQILLYDSAPYSEGSSTIFCFVAYWEGVELDPPSSLRPSIARSITFDINTQAIDVELHCTWRYAKDLSTFIDQVSMPSVESRVNSSFL